jgi:catalase (peroxidase I)
LVTQWHVEPRKQDAPRTPGYGNSGGGRRKGARNKLTERFLDAIADDFAEHGADAIAKVWTDDPATYLKIVSSIVPRELIMQREESPAVDYAELSHEEVIEVIDRRRKQKAVEKLLISIG